LLSTGVFFSSEQMQKNVTGRTLMTPCSLTCREELARLAAVHPADEIAEAAARAAAAAAEQQVTAAALAERDHAALAAAAECEWADAAG
jgi:hypothetical protein